MSITTTWRVRVPGQNYSYEVDFPGGSSQKSRQTVAIREGVDVEHIKAVETIGTRPDPRDQQRAAESQRKFNEGQAEAKQRYEDFYNTPAQSWNPHSNNNSQSDSVRTIEVEESDGGFLGGLGLLAFPVLGAAMFAVGGVIYGAVIGAPVIAAGCTGKLALKAAEKFNFGAGVSSLLFVGMLSGAGVGTYSLQREYTPGINEIQHTAVENINNWAGQRITSESQKLTVK